MESHNKDTVATFYKVFLFGHETKLYQCYLLNTEQFAVSQYNMKVDNYTNYQYTNSNCNAVSAQS